MDSEVTGRSRYGNGLSLVKNETSFKNLRHILTNQLIDLIRIFLGDFKYNNKNSDHLQANPSNIEIQNTLIVSKIFNFQINFLF